MTVPASIRRPLFSTSLVLAGLCTTSLALADTANAATLGR